MTYNVFVYFREGPFEALEKGTVNEGTGRIWLDGLRCEGQETSISECYHEGWGVNNCNHNEDIAISCGPPGTHTLPL